MAIRTLAHHIDVEFLRVAYQQTRKDGATGVDEQTAADYATNLEANLQSLLDRFKSGSYVAPPVRRVEIPKGDGTTRPLGIPTFEDKVLQRAVGMVLGAVYEQDFLDCSYGFRPGRSAHQALDALWRSLARVGGGWVIDIDIRRFFDSVDHGHLRSILDQRVRDGVIRRTINKWLKAGVQHRGMLRYPDGGTPQGGVISPLLANVFLHEVLDVWFEREVKPRLDGSASLVRYADDAVMVFAFEADARRVLHVLAKRFAKYGLTLHPEKTKLVDFRCKAREGRHSETFDVLGFTHFWGHSLKGKWIVRRRTSRRAFTRALKRVAEWCRWYRHLRVREQHAALVRKVNGHYGYFGITGNRRALGCFVREVRRVWRKWLSRRSNRAYMKWNEFLRLERRYRFPLPHVARSIYHA
ncbi:MAG TPA: group II intron reverse transcriptase/maturase [Kofleriaceae bacterium]|nr:group II intron reverse transcriptase/maturase [Kofleriaceae bacterium]